MPTANESVRRYYLVDWDGCVLIFFRARFSWLCLLLFLHTHTHTHTQSATHIRFSWLCLLLFFTRALISPSGFRLYSYERIAQSFVYEDCTNRRRRNQIDTCLQSQEWERWSQKNESPHDSVVGVFSDVHVVFTLKGVPLGNNVHFQSHHQCIEVYRIRVASLRLLAKSALCRFYTT